MNTEWSLEVYYKGYEDPAFAEECTDAGDCIGAGKRAG